MKDSWHIGPRMRYWRKRRGMTIEALAGLLSLSPSKIQAAESGYRPFNRLDDLIRLAVALHVDLGAFLCDPVPGVADDDHAQVLALLREAFLGRNPREGLARLARRLPEADAGDDLMLVVLPGGRWKVVNRRDAIKLGAALGVSLASSIQGLNPDQAGELATNLETRTVSLAGVNALRAITTAFRRLDDEIGPAGLRPLVLGQLQMVNGLRRAGQREQVAVALSSVAAELDQLAGWLSFDLGDFETAQRHYRTALKAVEQAGDNLMAAHVLGFIGYMASYNGDGREAVQAAEAGLERALKTPSRTLRASKAILKGHAHAQAGDARAAHASLDLADTELRAANRTDDPEWMYYFGRWVVLGFRGVSLTMLGETKEARTALAEALGQMDPSYRRDRALFTVYLALALAKDGEIPEACRLGTEAADLLDRAYSPRVTGHLRELHRVQLRPHWRMPEVRELGDRLYAL